MQTEVPKPDGLVSNDFQHPRKRFNDSRVFFRFECYDPDQSKDHDDEKTSALAEGKKKCGQGQKQGVELRRASPSLKRLLVQSPKFLPAGVTATERFAGAC